MNSLKKFMPQLTINVINVNNLQNSDLQNNNILTVFSTRERSQYEFDNYTREVRSVGEFNPNWLVYLRYAGNPPNLVTNSLTNNVIHMEYSNFGDRIEFFYQNCHLNQDQNNISFDDIIQNQI